MGPLRNLQQAPLERPRDLKRQPAFRREDTVFNKPRTRELKDLMDNAVTMGRNGLQQPRHLIRADPTLRCRVKTIGNLAGELTRHEMNEVIRGRIDYFPWKGRCFHAGGLNSLSGHRSSGPPHQPDRAFFDCEGLPPVPDNGEADLPRQRIGIPSRWPANGPSP